MAMKLLSAMVMVSALLTQPCYAQHSALPANVPPSVEDRAEMARKKAEEAAADQAYKAMLKQTPATAHKVDPWGDVRTAPPIGK